jgi:hypothetical protein
MAHCVIICYTPEQMDVTRLKTTLFIACLALGSIGVSAETRETRKIEVEGILAAVGGYGAASAYCTYKITGNLEAPIGSMPSIEVFRVEGENKFVRIPFSQLTLSKGSKDGSWNFETQDGGETPCKKRTYLINKI